MSVLIFNCTAVLMDEERTLLKNACVLVENGVITSVGTAVPPGFVGERIDGRGQVLMPGFVNAHTHLPMTLMRGYGSGVDLHEWLNRYIFPAEDRWDPRAIRAATGLALLELVAGGVTCVADMYLFCDEIASEVAACGISANLARGCTLFAPEFDPETHSGFQDTLALVDKWHGYRGGQIQVDVSLHGEYTSNAKLWEPLSHLARERKLGMHIHLSETRSEHEDCVARYGKTPTAVLAERGVFSGRTIAAHCVWTTPEDHVILAGSGVSAVHNPASNLKLGSGIAPVTALRQAGVNVALGTDGVSSNNTTDLFSDMKLAAILHNGATCNPAALTAYDALQMATVNGAKALGRNTGRVAVGCAADLILVDFDRPHLIPCHDVIENLVYSAHCSDVTMTMARGNVLYREGAYLTLDADKIKDEVARYAMAKIFS